MKNERPWSYKGSEALPVEKKPKPPSKKHKSPLRSLLIADEYGTFGWTCPHCEATEKDRGFDSANSTLLKHMRESHNS